jgi:hypothetical protein
LATKYISDHAAREKDIMVSGTRGSGSYRKWLPSAMNRAALLGKVALLFSPFLR